MTSFFHMLYDQRRRTKHNRENFLSTALAGLIRRDRVAFRLLLAELGWPNDGDLTHRSVQTQVVLPKSQKKPDLKLSVGRGRAPWTALIECKLDEDPEERASEQIRTYQRLFDGPVALLAKRHHIESLSGQDWAHVKHRGSWEGFAERLWKDSRRLDPEAIPRIRRDFLDLAADFSVGGRQPLDHEDFARACAAQRRVVAWQDALRTTVGALLPVGTVTPEEDGAESRVSVTWDDDGPLEVWWEAEGPAKHLSVKGLGLTATLSTETGTPILYWAVDARPKQKSLDKATKLVMADEGWKSSSWGWWYRPLAESMDEEEPASDILARVLVEARAALASGLGLEVGDQSPSFAQEAARPLAAAVGDLQTANQAAEVLENASSELKNAVLARLQHHFGNDSRKGKRGRRKLYVQGFRSGEIELNTWDYMHADDAGVGLWLWLGGKLVNDELSPAFDALGLPPGVTYSQSVDGSRDLQLRISALHPDPMEARVEATAKMVITKLARMRKRIQKAGR